MIMCVIPYFAVWWFDKWCLIILFQNKVSTWGVNVGDDLPQEMKINSLNVSFCLWRLRILVVDSSPFSTLRGRQITVMTSRISGQSCVFNSLLWHQETSKVRVTVPLWWESTGDDGSPHKGTERGKYFHLITSLWNTFRPGRNKNRFADDILKHIHIRH